MINLAGNGVLESLGVWGVGGNVACLCNGAVLK